MKSVNFATLAALVALIAPVSGAFAADEQVPAPVAPQVPVVAPASEQPLVSGEKKIEETKPDIIKTDSHKKGSLIKGKKGEKSMIAPKTEIAPATVPATSTEVKPEVKSEVKATETAPIVAPAPGEGLGTPSTTSPEIKK